MKSLSLFALLLTSLLGTRALAAEAVTPPLQLSKDKVIFHIREIYSIPSNVPISMADPVPSGIPMLLKSQLTIGEGDRSQKASLYVSQDGRHYFLAEVQDLSLDPDGDRRNKIKLAGAPIRGSENAKVTIVEYSDFQCPFCRKAHLSVRDEWPKFADKARWVYKYFPLTAIHPWAESAAVAAACVQKLKPENFWAYGDNFYEEQALITKDNIRDKALEYANKARVDMPAFTTCYDNKETLETIKKDMAEGESVGVQSTPSFYVNGHNLRGFSDIGPLKEAVDAFAAGKHP